MSLRHYTSRGRAVPAIDRQIRYEEFELEGETANCKALVARRDHLLIGISPFNSRFSPDYVEALVDWAHSNFARIDILLPSEDDAARLLLANGVAPSKAARKARKEIGRHLRSAHSAVAKAGADSSTVRVFQISDFHEDANYLSAEIPFYLDTPALIGVESSVLAYHRSWSIGTGLFAGVYPLRVSPAQGYGVVTRSERWQRHVVARATH